MNSFFDVLNTKDAKKIMKSHPKEREYFFVYLQPQNFVKSIILNEVIASFLS
ncbi:hypothetical protein [Flavobacterium sp. 5]|uniref:hypothetical protein n=1 Tax=Flavobacterium sp. 5 TaxID=2035199 RepID=UPI0012FD5F60|nr:hypothetical protein [Flavobacterium sp. 5]